MDGTGVCVCWWNVCVRYIFRANVICATFFLFFFLFSLISSQTIMSSDSFWEYFGIRIAIRCPLYTYKISICICSTTKQQNRIQQSQQMELVVYSCPRCLPCTNKCARLFVSFLYRSITDCMQTFSIAEIVDLRFVEPRSLLTFQRAAHFGFSIFSFACVFFFLCTFIFVAPVFLFCTYKMNDYDNAANNEIYIKCDVTTITTW